MCSGPGLELGLGLGLELELGLGLGLGLGSARGATSLLGTLETFYDNLSCGFWCEYSGVNIVGYHRRNYVFI